MYNNINDILNRFKYTKFSPSVNEWINSYYSYNKNNTFINNNINSLVYLLFNSYFNSFLPEKYKMFYSKKNNSKFYSYKNLFLKNKPYKLEYSTDQNKSIFNFNIKKTSSVSTNKKSAFHNLHLFLTKNCSTTLKRIFISIPEIKYYMNHICINLYVFNKERYLIENKLKTIKKNSLKISNIKNKRTALIIPNTNKKALAISNKNKKYVFNKFIYYNIDNKSFFEETISKRLIETFFYRKYILDLYRNKFKFNVLKFTNIKHMLTNIYNKHIIINIINAKYLFVDNNILLDAIVRKLKNRKRRVLKVMRKAIYLSKVKDIHPLLLIKLEINKIINNYDNIISNLGSYMYTKNIKNIIFEYLKNTHLVGMRLEANGRLSKRLTASRSVHKIAYYGKIQNIYSSKQEKSALISRGFLKSNVEYLNKNSFNRIGSYGIRSHISTL